jgi:hypothetical protein
MNRINVRMPRMRALIPLCGALAGTSLMLAACMSDESDGLTKTRADATSYRKAHTQCWARAYSLLGSTGMDMTRQREFDSCMAREGWQDQRALFDRGAGAPQQGSATR